MVRLQCHFSLSFHIRQIGLISRMLISELYEIMVNKVTFVGLRGTIAPNAPPDLPLDRRQWTARASTVEVFSVNDGVATLL